MPLVLTQNEATASGHDYADVLGKSYQYPKQYSGKIVPGTPFVYYRGRRAVSGPLLQQAYLGTGVIGQVTPAGPDGLMTCTITDYRAFPEPLFFKDGDAYREPGAQAASAVGFYFQAGVRSIDDASFAAIVAAGAPPDPPDSPSSGSNYPDPQTAMAVDAVAMELALTEAKKRFAGQVVHRMPHNNPGYDINVATPAGETVRYIEVKGTTRSAGHFFMSEGERLFSASNSPRYLLWVFRSIDLDQRSGVLIEHAGEVGPPDLPLSPVQHTGTLAG